MRRYISIAIDPNTFVHYFLVTNARSEHECLAQDFANDQWAQEHGMTNRWIKRDPANSTPSLGCFLRQWADKERGWT